MLATPERVQQQDNAGWQDVSVGGEHAVAVAATGAVQVVPIGPIQLGN